MADIGDYAARMMQLFEGFHGAHGTHGHMKASAAKGGKQEIKGSAQTLREPVTQELWEQHLTGARPLGIIPIREDGMCLWGCIDIDEYDVDHGAIVRELAKRSLPLVVCRTKSGGAHVFLFLREPAPAAEVRSKLMDLAAAMGYGGSEVFPKQVQILTNRGDLGNWLNMPYLDHSQTQRYGVKAGGQAMSLPEFLHIAEEARVLMAQVGDPDKPEDETLNDGPPCLQHLATVGFPEGTRNNGLFALGVFCQKKYGERWPEMLEKYNRELMQPPLESDEVQKTIKSLQKKDYNYTCKSQPIVSYCNATLCRTRKFGVGGAGKYPVISGMAKLDAGENTLWFLDIEDERVELTTDQLMNYREFQRVCMEALTIAYLPMNAVTWMSMVGEAMANATVIQAPPETTTSGHFLELLEDFLTNRHAGTRIEDVLNGKPYLNEDDNRHYFRLRDLMQFLEQRGFDEWGRNKLGQRIEQLNHGKGGGRHFAIVSGRGTNMYWVDKSQVTPTPQTPLPASKPRPL